MGKYHLYHENGYLDVPSLIKEINVPFIYIVGARGIGKTYGTFKYLLENKIPFVYMRRTQTQIDTILTPALNPLTSVCNDIGITTTVETISKSVYGFFKCGIDGKKCGDPIGIAVALSTVKNIRGFDASRYKVLFFDEFIPEVHEPQIKEEFFAFCNAIETIGRNREIIGDAPLQVVLASNSNTICNPYFMSLGVVNDVYAMSVHKQQNVKKYTRRCFAIVNLYKSPISDQKKNTSLYLMNGENRYTKMALGNDYNTDTTRCMKVNFDEYVCLAEIGEIAVYKHKSEMRIHISKYASGTPVHFEITDYDVGRFCADFEFIEKCIYTSKIISFDSPVEDAYTRKIFEMYHRKEGLL